MLGVCMLQCMLQQLPAGACTALLQATACLSSCWHVVCWKPTLLLVLQCHPKPATAPLSIFKVKLHIAPCCAVPCCVQVG